MVSVDVKIILMFVVCSFRCMARVDSTLDFCSRRKLMDDRLLSSVRYEKVVSFTRSSRTHSSIDPSAIAPPSSFRKKPSLEGKLTLFLTRVTKNCLCCRST